MLAPFYLFNETRKANVYIVANDRTPVLIKRDLFVVPQITFNEVDSMRLKADVIVIPALSKRTDIQDTALVSWIRDHFNPDTKTAGDMRRSVDRLRPPVFTTVS
jgi:putative intracellular protease/amidase